MTDEIDPTFAHALRQELMHRVRTPRRRWRLSWRVGIGGTAALMAIGSGVAFATGVIRIPGSPVTTPLSAPVIATGQGTTTVQLGAPPSHANDISMTLTCLSAGTLRLPGGILSCSAADLAKPANAHQMSVVVPIPAGQETITVRAGPSARWRLQATYVEQQTTKWGVNGQGQTYGTPNRNGTPDLVAVWFDQGTRIGYVTATDLACASGRSVANPAQAQAWDRAAAQRNIAIPVYDRNGTTVIGTLVVGRAHGPDARTVPLSDTHLHCATPSNDITPVLTAPNVVGMTTAQATNTLKAEGVNPTIIEVPSTTVPVGHVITEAPPAGSKVAAGSDVTLSVSSGP